MQLKNINKSARHFYIRLGIFFLLYAIIFNYLPIITDYIHGYTNVNYEPYFAYLMYPMIILFAIIRWSKIKKLKPYRNKIWETLVFVLIACIFFLLPLRDVFLKFPNLPTDFIYYFPLTIGYIFLFTAIFNTRFVKEFSNDLFKIAYLFAIFLIIRVMIGKFWMYLSAGIFYSLSIILPLFSENVFTNSDMLEVSMEGFRVTIGAPCSGIYSLMTFLFLFIISVILLAQKNKIDYPKTILALAIGLVVVFILNIVRVAIIIFIGAYYSPELAIELFHEYLSAIFLIALFVGYLYLIFPRIVKK